MTSQIINLEGQRFGRLLVLYRSESNSKSGNAVWVCQCDCGKITTVVGSRLRNGHTSSCGCKKTTENANGRSTERLFRIWYNMICRCTKPSNDNFKWYGGRGISVCSDWALKYDSFREWAISNGYSEKMTIDRINPDGNYSPDNCQWVDMITQANNRSNNHIVQYQGHNYTVAQFAKTFGFSPSTIFNRLKLGWDIVQIINVPEKRKETDAIHA